LSVCTEVEVYGEGKINQRVEDKVSRGKRTRFFCFLDSNEVMPLFVSNSCMPKLVTVNNWKQN